jgi:hypothetical protein
MVIASQPDDCMAQPQGLQRLTESASRMSRDVAQNLNEVIPPQPFRLPGISLCQTQNCVNGFDGTIQELNRGRVF